MKLYFGTVVPYKMNWQVHVLDINDDNISSAARQGTDLYCGFVKRYELDLRLDLVNKSPSGFSWGYGGSGPHQLAHALIADVYNVPKLKKGQESPVSHHLARALVVELTGIIDQHADWVISDTIIRAMCERLGNQIEQLRGLNRGVLTRHK